MSSSEEYLESLLKSIMDGGNAVVSNSDADKPKSAIEMLTGEEPENVGDADAVNMSRTLSPEEIDAMFHPAHKILESEPWPAPENMSKEDSETRMDLASLGLEEISENNQDDPNGLDNLGDLSDLNAHNDQDTLDSLGDLNGLSNLDDLGDLRGLDDFLHEEQNSEDVLGEMALEESNLEEMALEESNLEEMALEESNLEEMALEESDLEEMALKESNLEEMALEESGLGEMGLEESGLEEMALEESNLEEMALEESNLEEMALEESDLKEIALEEPDLGEMALEESDLGEIALEESDMDDMILEESGEEDLDFSGMDDDLAEIGDLLKQSGQDDDIDDEMLALLSSVSDDSEESEDDIDPLAFLQDEDSMTEEEVDVEVSETETDGEEEDKKDKKRKKKEKKKKEKKSFFSRKKKKFEKETDDPAMDKVLAAADGELSEDISAAREVESGQDNAEVKKSGFFSKMATLLTESDDDEEDGAAKALDVTDELFDENKELLRELDQEDRKSGKKEKANKKKEKKEKKDKKSKKVARKDAEGAEETKKKKKPKKEKKVKEKVEEPQEPEKKISKKKVIPVILCCLTITVCVVLLSTVVPGYLQARDAHIAFDMANYEEAYDLLQGQRLSEDDELIMQKSRIILYLDRKIDSYRGYKKFGKDLEALNALIEGCALYYELLPDAETYNMTDQIRTVYGEILVLLSDEYGVSESTVMDILAYEDDVTYTEHLTAIITGESYSDVSGSETEIEAETLTVPDVLPEEQEILDNMPVEIN